VPLRASKLFRDIHCLFAKLSHRRLRKVRHLTRDVVDGGWQQLIFTCGFVTCTLGTLDLGVTAVWHGLFAYAALAQ
jgi:hypothetical protein